MSQDISLHWVRKATIEAPRHFEASGGCCAFSLQTVTLGIDGERPDDRHTLRLDLYIHAGGMGLLPPGEYRWRRSQKKSGRAATYRLWRAQSAAFRRQRYLSRPPGW